MKDWQRHLTEQELADLKGFRKIRDEANARIRELSERALSRHLAQLKGAKNNKGTR